jgi:hypothetical protein
MEKVIEYVDINSCKVGDTIILYKSPIGGEYGTKFEITGKGHSVISLKRASDGRQMLILDYEYPKVYKVTENDG